jgi:hypothetical protein
MEKEPPPTGTLVVTVPPGAMRTTREPSPFTVTKSVPFDDRSASRGTPLVIACSTRQVLPPSSVRRTPTFCTPIHAPLGPPADGGAARVEQGEADAAGCQPVGVPVLAGSRVQV